jgi:hypothetical protein
MTIVYIALAILAALVLIALLLPRKVVVSRSADVPMSPEEVIAQVASTEGFQTFNPYCTTDPELKITPFGPASGVGSGFRFEGKEGKGTQTVTAVTATLGHASHRPRRDGQARSDDHGGTDGHRCPRDLDRDLGHGLQPRLPHLRPVHGPHAGQDL